MFTSRNWNFCQCQRLKDDQKTQKKVNNTPKKLFKAKEEFDQSSKVLMRSRSGTLKTTQSHFIDQVIQKTMIQQKKSKWINHVSFTETAKRSQNIENINFTQTQKYQKRPHQTFRSLRETHVSPQYIYRSPRQTFNSPLQICKTPQTTFKPPLQTLKHPQQIFSIPQQTFRLSQQTYKVPQLISPRSRNINFTPPAQSTRPSSYVSSNQTIYYPQRVILTQQSSPLQVTTPSTILSPRSTKPVNLCYPPKKTAPKIEKISRKNKAGMNIPKAEQQFKSFQQINFTPNKESDIIFNGCSISKVAYVHSRNGTENNHTISAILKASPSYTQMEKITENPVLDNDIEVKNSQEKEQQKKAKKLHTIKTQATEQVEQGNNLKLSPKKQVDFNNSNQIYELSEKDNSSSLKLTFTRSDLPSNMATNNQADKQNSSKNKLSSIKLINKELTFSRKNKKNNTVLQQHTKCLVQFPVRTVQTINSINLDQESTLDLKFMEYKNANKELTSLQ